MKLVLIFCVSTVLLCSYIRAHDDCDDDSSSSSSSDSDEHHHGGGGHGGGGSNGRYTRANGGCGIGWIIFNRSSGRWCVKAFGGAMATADAEAKCNEYEATLTGFMNPEEQQLINDDALKVIPQEMGSIWLGARRTQPCLHQKQTANCRWDNSFYWTDGSTTGTGGFVWDLSQMEPDNAWNRTQYCVLYFAAPRAGESYLYGGYYWVTQKIDDYQCALNINGPGPRRTVGYVCGRKAK